MKPIHSLLTVLVIPVFLLAGCTAVTYDYKSKPAERQLKAESFKVRFTPEKDGGNIFTWFQLDIENTSDAPIEIDWNQTRYLLDGKNLGGFVWEGIDPAAIKSLSIPNDVVQPGTVFSKDISPQAKVAMAERRDHTAGKDRPGLYSGILPAGENGILLTVKTEGKLVRKRLTVLIIEEKK